MGSVICPLSKDEDVCESVAARPDEKDLKNLQRVKQQIKLAHTCLSNIESYNGVLAVQLLDDNETAMELARIIEAAGPHLKLIRDIVDTNRQIININSNVTNFEGSTTKSVEREKLLLTQKQKSVQLRRTLEENTETFTQLIAQETETNKKVDRLIASKKVVAKRRAVEEDDSYNDYIEMTDTEKLLKNAPAPSRKEISVYDPFSNKKSQISVVV